MESISIINLISKLMSYSKDRVFPTEGSEELHSFLIKDVVPFVESSEYTKKSQVITQISEVAEQIDFLLKVPELADKTVIGIVGTRNTPNEQISKIINLRDEILFNRSIPTLITGGDSVKFSAINRFNQRVSLSKEEYDCCNDFYKYKTPDFG